MRCQVAIPAVSTVSEDTVTNTFHFTTVDTEEGTLAQLSAALVSFYEAMDTQKGDLQNWAAARIKMYDLSEPEPRFPVKDAGLALTSAPSTDSTAHELCAVLSFHGEYVSGFSQARRRGRIYFGPIPAAAVAVATGYLATGTVTALVTAGSGLLTASNSASDWAWVVYSPAGNTSYPVVGGHVDNAVDVQRRRGFKASTRTTF